MRGLRRSLLAGLVALVGSSGSVVVSRVAAAEPLAERSGLRLVARGGEPVFERRSGEWVWLELGTLLVADGGPFEVRTRRTGYEQPIVADQVVDGDAVRLPAGVVDAFTGFAGFTHVTVTDAAGRLVVERDERFCPAGGPTVNPGRWAERVDADSPPSSPYPRGCPQHPFAWGAVWGLQDGWGVPSTNAWYSDQVSLADGTYTARVRVNQPFRDLFNIQAGRASVTLRFQVRTNTDPTAGTTSGDAGVAGHEHGHAAGAQPGGVSPATTDRRGRLWRPDLRPQPADAALTGAASAAGTDAGADRGGREPRPDLRPLPAFDIALDGSGARELLTFSATVWNAGTSPLQVQGTRRPGRDVMDAVQHFSHPDGSPAGNTRVGTFEWDPRIGHEHWHFTDFVAYQLRDAGGKVTASQKQAFCVGNTGGVNTTLPAAVWRPVIGFDPVCGSADTQSLSQRLDVGWGDTYEQFLPGQAIDVTDLPNGRYQLEVIVNPHRALHESDTDNNTVRRDIEIVGGRGQRSVLVPPHQGINA